LHLLVRRQAHYEKKWWVKWVWERESRLLATYEKGLCQDFDHVLTVTDEDQKAHLALFAKDKAALIKNKFTTLPICVDPDSQPPLEQNIHSKHIIHLGTMFWQPNIEGVLWFAQAVLPRIIQTIPDVCFTIAGKNPPPSIHALNHPSSPVHGHIEITGFVPDPLPLLSRSQVFIVPVRAGGGMRVKILDAWQWGIPIVSTTIGAEGIATQPGDNIFIADEPEAFARHVIAILDQPALQRQLRQQGRAWVEKHYNWQTVYHNLDTLYAPETNHQLA
jgi:glycosyltransferase involved in cell wall biosynthesis